jgi:outer membrane protein assembly factor BamA
VLRIFGPVPMSFDFGIPVAKKSGDDTEVFSFSLGTTL